MRTVSRYRDRNPLSVLLQVLTAVYTVLGASTVYFCQQTLRPLHFQLQYVRANNITALEEALVLKTRMCAQEQATGIHKAAIHKC